MGLFDRLKNAANALLGKPEEISFDQLREEHAAANTPLTKPTAEFLKKRVMARIEYPMGGGNVEGVRLVLYRGPETKDNPQEYEKAIVAKFEDVIKERCRTAMLTHWGKSEGRPRDALVITGKQALEDAKALIESGNTVSGLNEGNHTHYMRAAANLEEPTFLEFLKDHHIEVPKFHAKDGKYSALVIPIVDPVIARGVESYLGEILGEAAPGQKAKFARVSGNGQYGIKVEGDAVKQLALELQKLIDATNYFQRNHDVERRPRKNMGRE